MFPTRPAQPPTQDWLIGGGEMGGRIRSFDWARHPLGTPDTWPQSLKTVIRIMLTSRYAMWMGWGSEFYFFCNDAYLPTVGLKESWVLGASAREVWAEIWSDIGPRAESVVQTGEATWDESLLLFLERSGYAEETYHTFSYSPLPGDSGLIGGMLCVVTEDTERVLGERRLALLRELGADIAAINTEDELFGAVEHRLASNAKDLPFALIYLFDLERKQARLVCAVNAPPEHSIAPPAIDLSSAHPVWPAEQIRANPAPLIIFDLQARFGTVPSGPWEKAPRQAVIVPIARQGQEQPAGFLVAGINPYRPLDSAYSGFINLLTAQIAAGLSNARVYEEERRRAEALAELDRAKTAFFSNVSHEFRTPLTLLLGPLDDMLSKAAAPLASDTRERLALARRNGQRLLKLVNTLLDFSRIEAGRVQAAYEPVDLSAYTSELVSVFRSAVERAGMRLIVDCSPLPEAVFVDRDMWEKIVLNLVSNAFKYTLKGEITVSLRAKGGSAILSVQDSGSGIPETELPKIFNRFHRVEGASGRTHEGTGIGLALTHELVKLHGGTVRVDSALGKGSTFTVNIPLGKEHLPADRVGASRALVSTALGASAFVEEAQSWLPGIKDMEGESSPLPAEIFYSEIPPNEIIGARLTILLADDNGDMRNYVRRLLLPFYEVIGVADGDQALRAVHEHKPDLVLTDVMMPRMNGFELLKALRENPETASTPIILLSARAGEEARVEGLKSGADDYLIKPFSARELLARVGGALTVAKLRREALRREVKLRQEITQILESINLGFLAVDREFCFVYVNAEAEKICQTSRHDLLGRSLWKAFPSLVGTYVEAELRRALVGNLSVGFETFISAWAQWFEVNAYPMQGDKLGIYFRDITDRKRNEEELQEADKRKDEFIATLAHELRNPLAPIRNAVEILSGCQSMDPDFEWSRNLIDQQVKHLTRLVDDLLDVSRITSNILELRKQRVTLADVIDAALGATRPMLAERAQQLSVRSPGDPFYLDADPVRLAQVLINLITNAIKYTPREGRIELEVECKENRAIVRVVDNGIGIAPDQIARLFEAFYQADRSYEQVHGGLGIGLTLAKRLVEMHGGTIEARSAGIDEGSEFIVSLPLIEGPPAIPAGRKEPALKVTTGRRILIVDDYPNAAESLARWLRRLGNEVQTALDGFEAVAAAEAFRPQVVLLDLGMPKLNGYETAQRIRDQSWGKQMTLVALTGLGQEEDRERTREAGFDAHLVKPVDNGKLAEILQSLAATPKLAQ